MSSILDLAAANLISPIILSFALGLLAAFARSDLTIPEAVAKGMSIYLLFAIGFKGGASVASHGVDATLLLAVGAGVILSFGLPLIAFALLKVMTNLSRDRRRSCGRALRVDFYRDFRRRNLRS